MTGDDATASATAASLALLHDGAAVGLWEIDPGTSVLEFRVKHFWGAMTVRGRFAAVSGRIEVAATGAVSGTIQAESASVDTGNASRDKHLRSADFFDVANHPAVVFSLDTLVPSADEVLRATGVLMAAGRSQSIAFDAHLTARTAQRITMDGEVSVNRRSDFGMQWSPLGMASPTALLVIHAVLVKSGDKTESRSGQNPESA
jgi:polyisoprenoid-binding protein YceI